MAKLHSGLLFPIIAVSHLWGCSGSDAGGTAGNGGSTLQSNGGSSNVAGSSAAVGGSTAQAGDASSSPATGGAAAGGGLPGTGGVAAVGGNSANTGGAPVTGGTAGTGGTKAAGGTFTATGGSNAAGGTVAATGGSKTTGGAAATGGVAATGGSKATGGSTSAGGCVESTCGSHKWPCWKMPNPASAGLPNPASYTDLGAGGTGAVRDNVTCLVWEKSPPAQPSGTTWYWQDNNNRCASLASSSFAGFTDWRLPTRVEMASITDYTRSGYASIFTSPSSYWRTGSDWYETITGQNTNNLSWIFGSNGFTSNNYSKTTAGATARCVRGNGAGEAQGTFAVEPANHYGVNVPGTGEVTDNYTGLIWQQGSSAAGVAWTSAASTCSGLGLNGHTWRVPTITELQTLVNEALVGPAINRTVFPNTKYGSYSNNWYWANATFGTSANGWAINFDDGFTGYNAGTATGKNGGPEWNYFTSAFVKCVR